MTWLKTITRRWIALVATAAALVLPADAQQNEGLAGRSVTVVIGLDAGGTADTFVRAFVPFLKKHTAGNPNVVVQNMPGAGGLLATNFLYEVAKPDGLTISYGPWDPIAQALANPALRARYEKFEFIGGVGDTRINYVRTDAIAGGLKTPADIVKADLINMGALNSTDLSGIMAHLSLEVLGVKHKFITGYRGGNDIFLAVQRNEVQFHNTSIGTYRTRAASLIKDGTVMGISYLVAVDAAGKFQPSTEIKEMPAFPDLVKAATGKAAAGPSWDALNWLTAQTGEMTFVGLAPPSAPADVVVALRKGFEAATNDPEFVAQSIKINGLPYSYVPVARGQAIFGSLAEVQPGVLTTLKATIEAIGR